MVLPSSHWWFWAAPVRVPAGIIVPFDDVAANIPSGWTQFTSVDGKALFHTNVSGDIGTTGGSTYVSRSTSTNGNHTGSANSAFWLAPSVGTCGPDKVGAWQGSHSHSCRVNYYPARRHQVMMKSTSEQDTFPAKTGVLSDISLSSNGLTEITPDGYALYGTSGASSANYTSSASLSSFSTAGSHSHIESCGVIGSPGTGYFSSYNKGGHSTHSGNPSVTDNIYRAYFSMWSNASSAFEAAPGMYALYESLDVPNGWAICDGNNGTPNLSDHMIGLTTNSSLWGTTTGDGTITTSASLGAAGSHNHNGGSAYRNSLSTGYHLDNVDHNHTIGSAASAFYPPWYKLVIMKLIG